MSNSGTLAFNRGDTYAYGGSSAAPAPLRSGARGHGVQRQQQHTGATTVSAGSLYIDGDQTAATGATTVTDARLAARA